MPSKPPSSGKPLAAAALITIVIALPVYGNETAKREGLFWGFGLGGAYLERTFSSTNEIDDAQGRLFMEFYGGVVLNPHISIGLEIGGWLIEPDSNTYIWNPYWPPDNGRAETAEGEGLMQILVFTRLYPYEDQGLFIKLAGGVLEHWIQTDYRTVTENGWTAAAGVGWDFALGGQWSVTPTLSGSYGMAGKQTHQAVSFSISLMRHQWSGGEPRLKINNNSTGGG